MPQTVRTEVESSTIRIRLAMARAIPLKERDFARGHRLRSEAFVVAALFFGRVRALHLLELRLPRAAPGAIGRLRAQHLLHARRDLIQDLAHAILKLELHEG